MTEAVIVALDQIRLNTYNPNTMDAETFNALLKDMEEVGLEGVDPILLRPLEGTGADAEPAYEVVDGEHRTRAALRLGWTEIGARVREMGLEEAMVVNYRKNRERGRLDPVKEGRLYKWWQDKGLTQTQIGAKFDVTQAHVSMRIRNVENVEDEAIQVLRGQKPSTDDEYKALYTQPELKEKSRATKKTAPRANEPVEATKLDLLGSINLESLLKRSRLIKDLKDDIPEEARLIEELPEKYGEKVRNLQVEVAAEIREKSFRDAEAHVADRWGSLVIEASNEREDRERRALKAELEKNEEIAIVILPEDRNWTHRDRLTDDKGAVLSKCLYHCPQRAVMITTFGKTEEICANGTCWTETKEELRAEKMRAGEEAARRLTEAREKIISAGEAGDHFWLRLLLFLVSLNRDTRPGYLDQYNLSNRWKPIVGMTDGQVMGKLLTLVADNLCRPRREDDEVDFLQVLNAISKQYGIERDYLLWKPEEIQDVELEAAP